MILTCDNCQARYLVPAHAIGYGGRRVRCANCSHEWHQPEDEEENSIDFSTALAQADSIPDSVKPVPEGSSVPSIAKDRSVESLRARLTGYAAAACVILLLLAGTIPLRSQIAAQWPPVAAFYAMFHLSTPFAGQGLVFDHVKAQSGVSQEGVKIIRVEGRIINPRSVTVKVPSIIASLQLSDGKELDHWTVAHAESILKPQSETVFSTSYPQPSGDVTNAVVGFVLK